MVDNADLTPEKAEARLTEAANRPDLAEKAQKSVRPEAWDGSKNVLALIDNAAQ